MAAPKSALQRTCFFIATSFAWTIPQLASAEPMNRVVVLNEGYDRTVNDALLVESTVTLVRSKDVILVSDPGMVSDPQKIVRALREQKIDPKDVTHVFVTHLHPDHTAIES